MAKVQTNQFESAGWLFWGVGVAILVGPAIYLASRIVWPGTSPAIWVSLGIVLAVLCSGLFTASVNAVLQRKARNRRAAERKKSKK